MVAVETAIRKSQQKPRSGVVVKQLEFLKDADDANKQGPKRWDGEKWKCGWNAASRQGEERQGELT